MENLNSEKIKDRGTQWVSEGKVGRKAKFPIYKDPGHGVTARSLSFWGEQKNKIGRVTLVECNQDYVYREKDRGFQVHPGVDNIWKEWNLKITGTKGAILLSGCTCGYGGEGPHGTSRILKEIGVDYFKADGLPHLPSFSTPINACYVCLLYGEIDGGDWVDYGSTRVQTPINYGCKDGWDYDEKNDKEVDTSKCLHLKERPFCKIHSGERMGPMGCEKCIEATYGEDAP